MQRRADAEGRPFDAAKTYRLTLLPEPPVADF